jgi:hypothetical protein
MFVSTFEFMGICSVAVFEGVVTAEKGLGAAAAGEDQVEMVAMHPEAPGVG